MDKDNKSKKSQKIKVRWEPANQSVPFRAFGHNFIQLAQVGESAYSANSPAIADDWYALTDRGIFHIKQTSSARNRLDLLIEGKITLQKKIEMDSECRWLILHNGKQLCGTLDEITDTLEKTGQLRSSSDVCKRALGSILCKTALLSERGYGTYSAKPGEWPDPKNVFPSSDVMPNEHCAYESEPASDSELKAYVDFFVKLPPSHKGANLLFSGAASSAPIIWNLRRNGAVFGGILAYGVGGTGKSGASKLASALWGQSEEKSSRWVSSEYRFCVSCSQPIARALHEVSKLFTHPGIFEQFKSFASSAQFGISGRPDAPPKMFNSEAVLLMSSNHNPYTRLPDDDIRACRRRLISLKMEKTAPRVENQVAPLLDNGPKFGAYLVNWLKKRQPQEYVRIYIRVRDTCYPVFNERTSCVSVNLLGCMIHSACFGIPFEPKLLLETLQEEEIRRDDRSEIVFGWLCNRRNTFFISQEIETRDLNSTEQQVYDSLFNGKGGVVIGDREKCTLAVRPLGLKLIESETRIGIPSLRDLEEMLKKHCAVEYKQFYRGMDGGKGAALLVSTEEEPPVAKIEEPEKAVADLAGAGADLAAQMALIYEEEFEKNKIASYASDESISLGENPGGEIPYVSTGTDEISAGTPGTATLHFGESRQPGASRVPSEL